MSKANKSYLREYKGYVFYHAEITSDHKNITHEVHAYIYQKNLNIATSPFITHKFEMDQSNALNKAIEDTKKIIDHAVTHIIAGYSKERTCRVCGCTEDDCSQCIEKTGNPCHWIEQGLCSACQEEKPAATTNKKIEPIIKFIKFRAAKTKGESHLISKLNIPLADWLSGAIDMDGAMNITKHAITDIESNSKYKYHNRITAERAYNPDRITIYLNGVSSDKKEELCGFMPISLSDKSLDNFFNKQNNSNMATAKKIEGPAVGSASTLTMVPLDKILTSPTNKLHREDWELKPEALKELIESVGMHGVLQPILLRINSVAGKFYLVCGERRFTAAKAAGLKEIPANIRQLNDEQAFELQIIENLQRKDVHPLKEAEAYKVYMAEKQTTIDDLAAKFSKSKDYIMQRLSFNNLIPEMKKEFYAGKMAAGHAALFARLTEADQTSCLTNCKEGYGDSGVYMLIDDVKEYIAGSVMMLLTKAAFSLTEKVLVPAAGSCADCTKRSGAGLFGDIKEKDRCFDKACFALKSETHLLNLVTDLLENNPDTPIVKMSRQDSAKGPVKKMLDKAKRPSLVKYHDFDTCNKTDKGAIRALCVAGSQSGEYVYIKMKKKAPVYNSSPSGAKQDPPKTPLSEKIKDAEKKVQDCKNAIDETQTDLLQKKLFDFKPFKDVDPKPLTKYEKVAFLLAIDNELYGMKMHQLLKKVKTPGFSESHKAYKVEQFANLTEDMITYISRLFIVQFMDGGSGDDEINYLTLKMAEENAAIKLPEIEATAAKKFEKELKTAEEALAKLKDSAPAPKPVVKEVKKAAPKKAPKK